MLSRVSAPSTVIQKAGHHMESTVIAAYIGVLVGLLAMDGPVRERERDMCVCVCVCTDRDRDRVETGGQVLK